MADAERIAYVAIDDLRPHPLNPKMHSLEAVAASIRRFGFITPLVVNEADGLLLEGHGRVEALEAMRAAGEPLPAGVRRGWRVPVVQGVSLDEAAARAFLVASNRTVELGGWDTGRLAALLGDLSGGSGIEGTGYTLTDLEALVRSLAPQGRHLTDPDDVPDPPAAPYAPYGVAVASRVGTAARTSAEARTETAKARARRGYDEHQGAIENDDLGPEALEAFLLATLGLAKERTRPGAAWYVCAPHGPVGLAFARALTSLDVWKASLVWVKDSLVMGRQDYHYRHEPIYYGWTPGAAHHAVKDRAQDSVWEIPRPKRSLEHPTMKPVALVERALLNSTNPGEVVYDPFAGSGTTIIACEAQGRIAYGMELSPRYAQVAIERWEAFTGRKAVRIDA